MYIKLIGALFLMSSTSAIGFLKAGELAERVKKLQELKHMMMLLQGELRFHRAEIAEAFENVAEKIEDPFAQFLKDTSLRLRHREKGGFEQIWRENVKQLLNQEGFLKEDFYILELLGSSFGYLDLALQIETLNLVTARTEESIRQAVKKQESRGRLYQTMGVTVGALLTLLMI